MISVSYILLWIVFAALSAALIYIVYLRNQKNIPSLFLEDGSRSFSNWLDIELDYVRHNSEMKSLALQKKHDAHITNIRTNIHSFQTSNHERLLKNTLIKTSDEILLLAQNESLAQDLPILGFEACLALAIDLLQKQYEASFINLIELDIDSAPIADQRLYFYFVLDLFRYSFTKASSGKIAVKCAIMDKSLRLDFSEISFQSKKIVQSDLDSILNRVHSRADFNRVDVVFTNSDSYSFDFQITKYLG